MILPQAFKTSITRFSFAILFASLMTSVCQADMAKISHVQIGGTTTDATAAHGAFDGNEESGSGTPPTLLTLLNSGGTKNYKDVKKTDDTNVPSVTMGKMFSTAADSSDAGLSTTETMDAVAGFTGISTTWTFQGKTDAGTSGGPFQDISNGLTSGTLTLANNMQITGDWVLSLKIDGGFAVYLFEDISGVTSFDFKTDAITNTGGTPQALSHASLYKGSGGDFSQIPEPTSFLMWTVLGGVGIVFTKRRRRK